MLDSAIEWLKSEIKSPHEHIKKKKRGEYQWSGDIINLVELAYALIEASSIDDGEVEVKSFVDYLAGIFNLSIGSCYDFYYKMRTRSGSRTIFLDKLKKQLEARMDRDDDKNYRK